MLGSDRTGCIASCCYLPRMKEASVFLTKRGCLLCCRSCITQHVLLYCDMFKNSINLSSVSATLICAGQYRFPFKSPWVLRTSVTWQNYTLHSLFKWEKAQVMKDIYFKTALLISYTKAFDLEVKDNSFEISKFISLISFHARMNNSTWKLRTISTFG